VELNHASDVRSVGSDPSTGACRCLGYRVRESNPRFRSENPVSSPAGRTRRCDARDRAPGGDRTHVPRVAGACLATWLPVHSSGARTRTSMAGIKDQGPAVGRHLSASWSRHSGSNRALSHTRRACRAAVTMTAIQIVERTGIEPAAAALQVQLAPLAHASPWRSRRGSNSPIAVDSRASSPEDFGTRIGAPRTRPRPSHSLIRRLRVPPCRAEPVASQGIEPCTFGV
jgi:hypothetical protein